MASTVKLSSGQVLENVHGADRCAGRFCPIHNPSNHSMVDLPLFFTGTHMVRLLENGKIAIDPDDYLFNRNGKAILRNSAKCLNCGDEIVSSSRHDFQECSCGDVFVDGGEDYLRHGFKNRENYENTSIVVNK